MVADEALREVRATTLQHRLAATARLDSLRAARAAEASLKAIAASSGLSITRVHELTGANK